MAYEVRLMPVESRRTAVVAATTTWQEYPALWGQLLGEVWGCLHAGGVQRGCRNVMLYLDDVPNVEVGVLLDHACRLSGRVAASALPAGTAAMTVHHGAFGDVGAAHDAVIRWCAANGQPLSGTRWEVYGPHDDDPAQQWTEVYWLLSSPAGRRRAGGTVTCATSGDIAETQTRTPTLPDDLDPVRTGSPRFSKPPELRGEQR